MGDDEGRAKGTRKQDNRKATGQLGEEAACLYLIEANYNILTRNWRCRIGEIDIIAEQSDRFVFVEVRTRKEGGKYGTAAESVDYRKQQKVRDAAQVYLRSVGRSDASIRFDVIAITLSRADEIVTSLKHFEAAF